MKPKQQTFTRPRCSECAKQLPEPALQYRDENGSTTGSTARLYCAECAPVRDAKSSWKPLASGSPQRVFIIQPNPFAKQRS